MAKFLFIKCGNMTRMNYGVTTPLGVMYLASVVRKKGHLAKVLDMRFESQRAKLDITMREFSPDVIGLSAITIEADAMHGIAAEIKKTSPRVVIIAGGPHPTSYPREVLSDKNIDLVCLGEGEGAVEDISVHLDKQVENIPGIAFRRNGEIILNPIRPYPDNLDEISFPAWDLIDIEGYSRVSSMSAIGFRRYMGLFTSRGCPYRCIYCHNIFGKTFRSRTPQNVIAEMESLVRNYGIREFEIYDDIFNLDKNRAEKIFDYIIEKNLNVNISFPNGLRSDLLDRPFIEKMKKAGVNYVSIAVETASEGIQKLVKKNLNLDKVEEIIKICTKLRIFTRGFFMLGFPTETEEGIKRTIKFALRSRLHTAGFYIVTPFKGTELFRFIGENTTTAVPFRDHDYFTGYFNLSEVLSKKLFLYQWIAIIIFYLHPKRLFLILRDFPNKKFLLYYAFKTITGFFKVMRRGN